MDDLRATIVAARAAAHRLAALSAQERSGLLAALADAIAQPTVRRSLLAANAEDMARARDDEAAGRLATPLVKRLVLDDGKLDSVVDGLRQLGRMPELVGRVTVHRELDEGLVLRRVSCPLGVLGVVFEARPEA